MEVKWLEPDSFTVGDRMQWKRSFSDYPAPTWTLTYYFRGPSSFSVVATADGQSHEVDVLNAVSSTYAHGDYTWIARADDGTETFTVGRGRMCLLPDEIQIGTGYDPRSFAERTLDAIEAVIERRATKDETSYQIQGRELVRIPVAELLVWRDKYKAMVSRERRAARIANGEALGNAVVVRF